MIFCMNLVRLFHTVRYLRAGQIAWRVRRVLEGRMKVAKCPSVEARHGGWYGMELYYLRELLVALGGLEAWGEGPDIAAARAAAFRKDRFEFLNVPADFSAGIDWTSADKARLWRYQLHYFDYAKELALAPEASDDALLVAWMQDWIARNPPGTDVAWDSFTISARLMNWALAVARFELDDTALRASYIEQARYLAAHLEHDVAANHLLKNACALCVAGSVIDPAFLRPALALLQREVAEQILSDGGHYERSPMYHALVLEDLLIARAALGKYGEFLVEPIARMARFLAGILHPDGEIPLIGDSVLGEARSPRVLLALAEYTDEPADEFPESGFHVLRDQATEMHVIVKAGAPGPAYQLGHAHCDCMTYEMSLQGERVIVDTGVHGYADSPHRARVRGGAAHNTIEVEGFPQLETWGAFRVGRRYAMEHVARTSANRLQASAILPGGVRIAREIALEDGALVVHDEAQRPAGVPMYSHLHLAPGLAWEPRGSQWCALRGGEVQLCIDFEGAHASVSETQYFPRFGTTLEIQRLTLTASEASGGIRYRITPK